MKKKSIVLALLFTIIIAGFAVHYFLPEKPLEIALIPLDSRPCNTQYPQLLGKMANLDINIPSKGLDNYLKDANKEELWAWLESQSLENDNIIINTTELFNGGLIQSRDPLSYFTLYDDIERLRHFCRDHPDHNITVIMVLPRLLPSQFTDLWQYNEELSAYAIELDKALLKSQEAPKPANVPAYILDGYLNIYKNSHLISEHLIGLTKDGVINNLLIGQDDAAEYGITNAVMRDLKESSYQNSEEHVNEKEEEKKKEILRNNVHFVYGADELTILALAKFYLKKPVDFELSYVNEKLKEKYLPYEAITTEEIVENKLEFLNIVNAVDTNNNQDFKSNSAKKKNADPLNKLIIYNDLEKRSSIIKSAQDDLNYLGIMDVTYTNKGDVELYQELKKNKLLKQVDGYAGWNTASNTIGTELAHLHFYQSLASNYKNYTKEAKAEALRSYISFKYVRLAEDFIYQGFLRSELEDILRSEGLDPFELAGQKKEAEEILSQLFKPYEEDLNQQLLGKYTIGNTSFTVEAISAKISLPWERIFEAKVDVDLDINL